jgi:hypothetical protein
VDAPNHHSGIEAVASKPLAIAMLTILGSLGGAWLKDRISMQGENAADAVRIHNLEQYRDTHSQDSVHRVEFDRLDHEAIRRPEFDATTQAILRSLSRIESKLDKR